MPIDIKLVRDLVVNSKVLQDIDCEVAKKTGLRIVFSDDFLEEYLRRVAGLGLESAEIVDQKTKGAQSFISRFAAAWFLGPAKHRSQLIPAGVGISFLCWMTILENSGQSGLAEFLRNYAFNRNRDAAELAAELKSAYDSAVAQEPTVRS